MTVDPSRAEDRFSCATVLTALTTLALAILGAPEWMSLIAAGVTVVAWVAMAIMTRKRHRIEAKMNTRQTSC